MCRRGKEVNECEKEGKRRGRITKEREKRLQNVKKEG
jgi:hypothetical protein